MSIYDNIKEIAKERGLSIKEVAIKANIGENSIYRWQTKSPSTSSLNKVAKALNVDVEDLTATDSETPEYRAIQRKAKKLNPAQQEKLLKMMDLTFEELYDKNDK